MRWSLQQIVSFIFFSFIIAGVAGSPLQDETVELERRSRQGGRVPPLRTPSPQPSRSRSRSRSRSPSHRALSLRPARRHLPRPAPASSRAGPSRRGPSPLRSPRGGSSRSPSPRRSALAGPSRRSPSPRSAGRTSLLTTPLRTVPPGGLRRAALGTPQTPRTGGTAVGTPSRLPRGPPLPATPGRRAPRISPAIAQTPSRIPVYRPPTPPGQNTRGRRAAAQAPVPAAGGHPPRRTKTWVDVSQVPRVRAQGKVALVHPERDYLSSAQLKSSNYRDLAKNKGEVWAGKGKYARYPPGATIPSRQHGEHIYEAQQAVGSMRKAGIVRWSQVGTPEAQKTVKNFLKQRINNPNNLLLADSAVNGPKGVAIGMAQRGKDVKLDPTTAAYFDDTRRKGLKEATRTQVRYDRMRGRYNAKHQANDQLPAINFLQDHRDTVARIS